MSSYDYLMNYLQDLNAEERIKKLRKEQEQKEKIEAEEERKRLNSELEKGIDIDFEWKPKKLNENAMKGILVKKKETKNRVDNLTKAIMAAIEYFGKKPSFDELWQYFQNDRDNTGIVEDYTDTHLTWKDTKGNFHDTQKESLANRLSRLNI